MSIHVLIPDNWHFHRRNFKPLFNALFDYRLHVTVENSRSNWWQRHGDYSALINQMADSVAFVEGHEPQLWFDLRVANINLWRIAKAEFLCRVLPSERWRNCDIYNESRVVFDFALEDCADRVTLMYCLAAARDWLLFWLRLFELKPEITHVLVFSGSYIYTHSLLKLANAKNLCAHVLEHFYTGEDFYLEKRYSPIANRTILSDPSYLESIIFTDELAAHSWSVSRLRDKRNRNTLRKELYVAPTLIEWSRHEPVVLVIGQVLNDFSLIESEGEPLSALRVYKSIFHSVLSETNAKIIFKAHPWERKRPNLRRALTLDLLKNWLAQQSGDWKIRVWFCEHEPLSELFALSKHVVGICSQGLLESCEYGFKPWILGRAFYSGYGFTNDEASQEQIVNSIMSHTSSKLNFEEFFAFDVFMKRALAAHLLPNLDEAASDILTRLLANLVKQHNLRPENRINYRSLIRDVCQNPYAWMKDVSIWLKELTLAPWRSRS